MRTRLRLAARRVAMGASRVVPARSWLRLRSTYLAGEGSPLRRRVVRAMLDVVRLRGIPQDEPFDVPGNLFAGRSTGRARAAAESAHVRMVPSDSYIANHLFWLGADAYEPGGPAWWSCLTVTHRSVLEIGANIGLYTVVGARAAPSVRYQAVEANPASCRVLRRNLDLNGVDHVELLERAAVGDQRREVRLHFPVRDPYLSSCGAYVDGAVDLARPAARAISVPAVCISDLVDGVDLVKLDIEGLELELLAAVRSWIVDASPTLVVEVRDDAVQLQRFLAALAADVGYESYAATDGRVVSLPTAAIASGALQTTWGTRDLTLVVPSRSGAAQDAAHTAELA